MTRAFVKGIAAAGVAAGLVLSTTGVAHPAGKPPNTSDPRTPVRPVVFYDQARVDAQGLTPKAALQRASRFVHYRVTTPHYLPAGYRLVFVRVYPFIQYSNPVEDTQTFMNLGVRPVRYFEVDHQLGSPIVYQSPFVVTRAKLAGRAVWVAEEKAVNSRTHQAVDQLNVYWYDAKSKVATEVTAELRSTKLNRATIMKIAASIS